MAGHVEKFEMQPYVHIVDPERVIQGFLLDRGTRAVCHATWRGRKL